MARMPGLVVPDDPHHVTQGGNRRLKIFFCGDDYRANLNLLAEGMDQAGSVGRARAQAAQDWAQASNYVNWGDPGFVDRLIMGHIRVPAPLGSVCCNPEFDVSAAGYRTPR